MRRNPEFLLSEVAGNHVLIPIGKACADFNKLVSLNEMGVLIWNLLENEITEEGIVDAILAEYDVTRDVAQKDVSSFLAVLRTAGCLKED